MLVPCLSRVYLTFDLLMRIEILIKLPNECCKVVFCPYMSHNVSSISGVHLRDKAKLCSKYHITNYADWAK